MSWMNKNGNAPKRGTSAESASAGFKNGDKANCTLERISIKPSDNAQVISSHGQDAADNAISIMWRVKETANGKNVNRCLFQTLYVLSTNAQRAATDAQYLASIATLAEENHGVDGIYADLIEGSELPDDEILKDLIGTDGGLTVGVFAQDGKTNEFVRALAVPHEFAEAGDAGNGGSAAQGSGRRRRSRD